MKFISALLVVCYLLFSAFSLQASASTKMIMMTHTGFIPKTLSFSKGEKIQLIINNTDDRVHNLVIPELKITAPHLMKGEMAVSNFTAKQSGKYEFYSNSPGYKEIGYNGILMIK